jgi:hypothetical protein
MDVTTTPTSASSRSGFIPLLRELSSSFTSLGLQKRVEDDSTEAQERSAMKRLPSLHTPLPVPNTSIFDRNPQVSCTVELNYGLQTKNTHHSITCNAI